jgi:hypothetical protein
MKQLFRSLLVLFPATLLAQTAAHGCNHGGGLAIAEGNARKNCGKTYQGLFLRGLLPGPWGHGNRLELLGSEIRQPGHLCVAGRVGRQDHRRVSTGGILVEA